MTNLPPGFDYSVCEELQCKMVTRGILRMLNARTLEMHKTSLCDTHGAMAMMGAPVILKDGSILNGPLWLLWSLSTERDEPRD